MKHLVIAGMILTLVQAASGTMVITEWMYNGLGAGNLGEFVEFTNTGSTSVDMTGWSFDDSSRTPNSVDLSALGIIAPGQSIILTDETPAAFAANWGITGVAIVGGNSNNLGRGDEINLYDAGDVLVDRLTYGDEAYPGTIRTQNVSCNIPAADYGLTTPQTSWVLATVGDAYGSWSSVRGEIGSPGSVPEPASLTLLMIAGVALVRTRSR